MNRISSNNKILLSAITAALTLGSPKIHSATAIYQGTTGTSSGSRTPWSTASNWGGTAPTNNATLDFVFSPVNYNYSNNDITGLTASSITFSQNNYLNTGGSNDNDITGNGITLAGNLTDNTGNYQKVRIDMALGSTDHAFAVNNGQLEIYGVLSGTGGGITKSGGAPLILAGNNSYTGDTSVSAGRLNLQGAAAGSNNSNIVMSNNANLTFDDTGSFRQFNKAITGTAGNVTFNVVGNTSDSGGANGDYFKLSNTGAFTGAVVITRGLVQPDSDSTLGNAANQIQINPGTGNSAGLVATNNLSLTLPSTRSIVIQSGTGILRQWGGATMQIDGVISGSGGLTKTDGGTLKLFGANTFNGDSKIGGGTLILGNQNALQNSTLTTGGNGVVFDQSVSGKAFNFGGLAGSTNVALQNNAGSPEAIALTVGGNNATTSYGGVLSGGGSLTKTGTGKLTLGNPNTFSGGTIINNGTLELAKGGGAGAIRGTVTVNSGATLLSTDGDSFGYNGGTKVDTLNIVGGTVTHTAGGNLTLSSAIINMTGGTLSSTGGRIDFYNGTGTATTINTIASNTTATIGTGTLALREGDNSNATDTTWSTVFTVAQGTVSTGIDLDVTGTLVNGPSQGNFSAIVKDGAGRMRLTGTNTYSGVTTVNSGTLELANSSGSAAGSTSSIKVLSTGTLLLSNNNQISDSATVSLGGGTIKFGAAVTEGSTSAVGVGALTLTATSTIDFSSFASTLTFSSFAPGSSTLNVTNWTPSSSHLIFNADQSSNLSSFTVNSLAASQIDLGGGFYEITAVPEPGTIVGGIALLGCVGLIERKRIGRLLGSSSSRRIC